jgi:ABC-type nitrate/sulfonate/bicarbonate transport system substrate-binding protein
MNRRWISFTGRRIMVSATLLVLITGVAACGSGPSSNQTTSTTDLSAPELVNIGLTSGYNSQVAPYMVAFNDYLPAVATKFKTKFTTHGYGNLGLTQAAFFGGTDQLMIVGAGGFAAAAIGGQPGLAISQQASGPLLVVSAPVKYRDSRGGNVKAFDGGNWCYLGPGQPTEAAMKGLAKASGLDWSKQHGIAIGAGTAWIPTITSGQCDLSAMSADAAAALSLKKDGYVVANLSDPAIEKKVYGGTIMGTILEAAPSFVKQYPALTQAIVTAFTQGLLYVQRHGNDATAVHTHTPPEYRSQVSPEQFAEAWKLVSVTYASTNGLFDAGDIKTTTSFLASVNQIKQGDTLPADTYTNVYMQKAYENLGVRVSPSPA